MANTTIRTIPSAVLGEYLSDVQAVWAFTEPSAFKRNLRELNDPINRGLARNLRALYGDEVGYAYIGFLLDRAKAQREADAKARRQERYYELQAAKVEEPKVPKRRGRKPGRQSADTRLSDKRLREAMLKVVNHNGRVNRGLRRLAQDADMSEAAVRRALKAWEANGQLVRFNYGRGKTQSIKLDRSHPAWSEN